MSEPPPDVTRLAEERAAARARRDFAAADGLRDAIAQAGWVVRDAAGGFALEPAAAYDVLRSLSELPDNSGVPDTQRATVSVLVEGWPDDVRTCLTALLAHTPADTRIQVLDIGDAGGAGAVVHEFAGPRVDEWHVPAPAGWAAARRALLRADTAAIHVWCDPSTVFEGDALTPLLAAFDDADVVGAGWQGANVDVADDWRSFTEATGEVDAVLGYLFAMRRSTAIAAGGPDPKARFYRNADLEFSLMLRDAARAQGLAGRLVVPQTGLPCRQDRHRGYHDTDPGYRDRESRRNYRRLLDRFRGRADLLAEPDRATGTRTSRGTP